MATQRKRLTDAFIKQVDPPSPPGRDEYADELLPGLQLRVGYSGRKSFAVVFRYNGSVKRETLKPAYPALGLKAARDKARDILEDPAAYYAKKAASPEAETMTFEKLVGEYIERYAKRHKKTWKHDQHIFKRECYKWNKRAAKSITRQDVIAVIEKIRDRGADVRANRVLAAIRKLFNWAVEKGLLETTPVIKIKPAREKSRDRVLNDDELKAVWDATEKIGYPFGHIYQLAILLGQRRGEVAGMRDSQLDLDKAVWDLRPGDTKAERTHQIPLPPMAVEIIEALPRFETKDGVCELLFTTNGETAVSGFSKAKKEIDKLSEVEGWTLHDVRTTMRTNLAALGISWEIGERILNHSVPGLNKVTATYDIYHYLPEKRRALELWASRLQEILKGKKRKVVRIHG